MDGRASSSVVAGRASLDNQSPPLAVPASGRVRILGVDPGSRFTGYGIIDFETNHAAHIHSGTIKVKADNLAGKLRVIFDALGEIMDEHRPDEFAIERVFMHRNADSALKLGQARGAALLAASSRDVPVFEYSPNAIKQSVTGRGHAAKQQIQHMIKVLLCLSVEPQTDCADALAVAMTHGHIRQSLNRLADAGDGVKSSTKPKAGSGA